MSASSLYEQDVLLWSEQQAAILRALARDRRDLPNDLDIENVAEEIESVGLSELHGVESRLRLILARLLKAALEPDAPAVRHWRSEILDWHAELEDRFTPSMRQRIDLDRQWLRALRSVIEELADHRKSDQSLQRACPLPLDALLADEIDLDALIARLRTMIAPTEE